MRTDTPKSQAGKRTVSFPAEIAPEIQWHLERFAEPGERGWVFVGPKGAPLRRSNFHRSVWGKAPEQVGLPELHFHDLRHTGGTLSAAVGATLRELMARLGHSSMRAALIYQHVSRDRDQAIAKALGTFVRDVRDAGDKPSARARTRRARRIRSRRKRPCGTCMARMRRRAVGERFIEHRKIMLTS